MAEKDVATTVDEKDYEHHLTWRGWLSFVVIALSFSGVLKDMGPLSAFDFTVLVGKFGKISDTFTFIGKGGIGASEGFMFALTLMPTVITRDLVEEGKITDDERTIFVAYQYAASGTLANTINCGAPLMPISLLSFGIIFMVEIIVKIIGANIVRFYLMFRRKKAGGAA